MDMPKPTDGHLKLEKLAGNWEGDVLTMAHGSPGPHMRMTYDLTGPETLVTRGEMSEDGVAWTALFDGRHRQT